MENIQKGVKKIGDIFRQNYTLSVNDQLVCHLGKNMKKFIYCKAKSIKRIFLSLVSEIHIELTNS